MEKFLDILKNEKDSRPDRNGFTQLFRLAHDINYIYNIEEIGTVFKQFATIDLEQLDADDISNLVAFLVECKFFFKEEEVSSILKKWYYRLEDINKKSELFVILSRMNKGLQPNELIDKTAYKIKENNLLLWIEGVISSIWFDSLRKEVIDDISIAFCELINKYDFVSEFLSYMSLLLINTNNKENVISIISFCLNKCESDNVIEIENWMKNKGISVTNQKKESIIINYIHLFSNYADDAISKVNATAAIYDKIRDN